MGTWELIGKYFQKLSSCSTTVPNLMFLAYTYPETWTMSKNDPPPPNIGPTQTLKCTDSTGLSKTVKIRKRNNMFIASTSHGYLAFLTSSSLKLLISPALFSKHFYYNLDLILWPLTKRQRRKKQKTFFKCSNPWKHAMHKCTNPQGLPDSF